MAEQPNGRASAAADGRGQPATSIAEDLQARARPFLDLVDALCKDGVNKEIAIPQIAVMGDQSSGKSSVLEAISGIQFPRGAGLVTRCATQITMSQGPEWSAELHAAGEVRTVKAGEEAALTRHIQELTAKLCGDESFCGKDKRIEIKLQAPDTPDLTIIDLPGIVRTATNGQSEAVKDHVDGLLKHYLEQSRTIILAVIPCNVDIATVDILERARQVDPNGDRTIGVLTKPDLVDKGGESEVMSVLANSTKPLRHGYFMLKNKSQEQLNGDPPKGAEARHAELAWLANSKYGDSDRLGVQVLQRALTQLLVSRIEQALPSMLKEVGKVLAQTETEIVSLGENPPTEHRGCRSAALTTVREVVGALRRVTSKGTVQSSDGPRVLQLELRARKEFVKAVEGARPGFDGEKDCYDIEVTEVPDNGSLKTGVTRRAIGDVLKKWGSSTTTVGYSFSATYSNCGYSKGKVVRVCQYFRGDLAERIQAGRGRELPGFMNFDVFCAVMGEYVDLWKGPSADFHEEVQQAVTDAVQFTVDRYASNAPSLAEKLKLKLEGYLKSCAAEAHGRLVALLEQEKMPSTENHYLWDTINKIRNKRIEDKVTAMASSDGKVFKSDVIAMLRSDIGNDSNESQEVQDMIDYLSAYWKLAMKRYVDEVIMIATASYTAPKRIDEIEAKLTEALLQADDESLVRMFRQDQRRVQRRSELKDKRDKMHAAKELITQFQAIHGLGE